MRTVQIALKAIEVLGAIQPAGVSELARAMDLPKSTVQRCLTTLHQAGWIESAAQDQAIWVLSLQALIATGRADYAARSLRAAAIPVMEELRRRTEESVYLAVLYRTNIALVERLDGIRPVAHAWPLWRSGPLYRTSLGRSILAAMTPADLEGHLRNMPVSVDMDALRTELDHTASRGFAIAVGSNFPDENGVGAAIRNGRGAPTAAISISAPKERMSEADCISTGPLILDAARRISMGVLHNPKP